jgi:hypothetical protein
MRTSAWLFWRLLRTRKTLSAPETGIEPHFLDQVITMVEDLVEEAEADQAGLGGRTDHNSHDEGQQSR